MCLLQRTNLIITMSTTYETVFNQAFFNNGVNLSPQEHAEGRMAALRQSYINTAMLDPRVGAARFGLVTANGVGNEWTVNFNEKAPYTIAVQFDDQKKDKWSGKRTRKIGYTLSVTVVQTNIPNVATPTMSAPPHYHLSLA